QLLLCRHRDPRGCLCRGARRKRRDRPCSWANAASYGAELGARWNCALRTRTGRGGPCDPLRALPGDWRVPRGDRMADGFRRQSGHYGHASCRCQYSCAASFSKLTAATAIAVSLYFGLRRFRNPLVLLGLILAGIAAAHFAFFATGLSITDAQAAGWLFKPAAAVALTLPWSFDELSRFPWAALSHLAGGIIALMFVTVMSVLFNVTGIEVETCREADLERELNAVGSANLLSASLGGYVACSSLSRTTLNYEVGGRGRLSGLTVAAVSGLVLAAGSGFLAYVPKFV